MNIFIGIFLAVVIRTFVFGDTVLAECIYENTRYSDGSAVPTAEPCLRCACARNTLLCYLRVCPELPDPPPPGCLILHRHRQCCPELICADAPAGNRIEARYEPDLLDFSDNHASVGHGCIHNGTIYGSGSAMQTSSLCEYCYCINGKEHCVKPKCLLPVEGCKASYAPHSCCPTHYKCRGDGYKRIKSTTTTIAAPVDSDVRGGCIVSGQRYPEGGKILGIGHSPCDNCYCMRGVVRCVPLQCAPPLLGCNPVVPQGECCAASYNCSGVIEVQPNYGPKPLVSKDYSHIRKEAQQPSQPRKDPNIPHYILPESTEMNFKPTEVTKSSTPYYFTSTPQNIVSTMVPTSRQIFATTKHLPIGISTPESSSKYSKISLTTTRVIGLGNSTEKQINEKEDSGMRPIFKPSQLISETTEISPVYNPKLPLATTTEKQETYSSLISKRLETTTVKVLKYSNYVDIDFANDFIDGRNNRRIDDITTATEQQTTDLSTTDLTTETTVFPTTTFETTTESENTTLQDTTENSTPNATTIKSQISITGTEIIGNNTECIDSINNEIVSKIETRINYQADTESQTTTEDFSTTTSTDETTTEITTLENDIKTENNNISVTMVPFKKINPDIEAILNITKTINKKDEDYEYDYNEPSLPPSLPNLKIIPFVAADAVLEEKGSATVPYSNSPENLRETDTPHYGYTERYTLNLFSPPIETEGGFVPRDPPILNTFYENSYHTTGVVDITSGTSVPAITNPPKTSEDNCIVEGREVRHGELTSEIGACSVCLCLFGDIVCQPPKCPEVPPGCRRAQPMSSPPVCCGHIVCNGNEESPTVVLDRIDVTSNPEDDPHSDPFRDVIRTEPAPDLQSLIGDIMPYLVRQTTTLKSTTHMTTPKPSQTQITTQKVTENTQNVNEMMPETKLEEENDFSLDSVFKLLFTNEKDDNAPPRTTNKPIVTTTVAKIIDGETKTASSAEMQKFETTKFPISNSWYLDSKSQENDGHNKNVIDGSSSVGLLKLAGCNIYGRMYRVGRIISELSGPCLECMCTEIGVQCKPLNC